MHSSDAARRSENQMLVNLEMSGRQSAAFFRGVRRIASGTSIERHETVDMEDVT
jgi:hypothetical protein